ncbi:MAG: hypothetical protein M3O62_12965, partial [Pseudomonadota bacterium]|nr:hypothetical protein [Pseudomonadota bacterium]
GMRRAKRPADFRAAVADPVINALMTLQAGRLRRHTDAQKLERVALFDTWIKGAPEQISEINRNRVLSDPDALASLHLRVWTDDSADPQWRQ